MRTRYGVAKVVAMQKKKIFKIHLNFQVESIINSSLWQKKKYFIKTIRFHVKCEYLPLRIFRIFFSLLHLNSVRWL